MKDRKTKLELKYERKLKVLLDISYDENIDICSEKYGVGKSSIYRWINEVNQKGIRALKYKKGTGRPKKLSKSQLNHIESIIKENPIKYGYNQANWTGIILADYIEKKYKINISTRMAQKLVEGRNIKDIEKDKVFNFINKLDEYLYDNDNTEVWHLLWFKVWDKEVEGNKFIAGSRKIESLYYYMAINERESKLLWYQGIVHYDSYMRYKEVMSFIEAILNEYVTEERKIVFVMNQSPMSKKVAKTINLSDLKGKELEILIMPSLKNEKSLEIDAINPLYLIKKQIKEKIRKNRDKFNTKVSSKIIYEIEDIVINIAEKYGYSLY